MMKMLSAVVLLVLSMSAFASSQVKTFFYDGSQSGTQMSLRTEKTHTEYRYEQRRSICYRQEMSYRQQCQRTPQGTICQTIPVYRTISYPCMETVRVGFEVKDYDVEANIDLNVVANASTQIAAETLKVSLDGDSLSVSAVGSKRFFVVLTKSDVQPRMTGSVKMLNASYTVELVEAAPVLKSLTVTNIAMKDSTLSYTTGVIADRDLIGLSLNVKKAPLLGSDTVLFDRELASNEVQLNADAANTIVNVDLQTLGVKLQSGRHLLTGKIFFKYAGSVLNKSDFEKLEATRTLIYKL
jgi:hypothetical protein